MKTSRGKTPSGPLPNSPNRENEAGGVTRKKRAQETRKHAASGTSRAPFPAPLLETIERFCFALVNVEDGQKLCDRKQVLKFLRQV